MKRAGPGISHFSFLVLAMAAILSLAVLSSGVSAAITSVSVSSPNGGEKWSGTQSITWTSDCTSGENVKLYLYRQSTSNTKVINNLCTLACNSLSYSWSTAGETDAANDYKIKIVSCSDLDLNDFSDNLFTIDNHPPTTTESESGTIVNGWHTSSTSVTLSCADTGPAGCANTYYILDGGSQQTYSSPFPISADGTYILNYWSTDQASNVESQKTATIKVDTTAPTTTIGVGDPKSGTSHVYVKSSTAFTLGATDGSGSGVQYTEYKIDSGSYASYFIPFTVSGAGSHTVYYRSRDNANNLESEQTLSVYVDDSGPSVTGLIITPSYGTTYVSGTSTITASVSDGSGSGVAGCEYTLNGGSSWAVASYSSTNTCTASAVNTASASSINMRATDNLGNVGTGTAVPVTPDTAAPTTTISIGDPKYGSSLVYVKSTTQFTLSAGDGSGSGLQYSEYKIDSGSYAPYSPFTVSGVGSHTIYYRSRDNVNNLESDKTLSIYVDDSGPAITVTGAPSTWQATKSGVTASADCSDGSGSGCDAASLRFVAYDTSQACSINYGDYSISATITSHKWVCAAEKDNVGNTAFSASAVEFKVSSTIQAAINAADSGSTINVALGTYPETLNLGGKSLTIEGAGIDSTIIDAHSFTGYAIQNFGGSSEISDLTLIGTGSSASSYGFKVSHVSGITLEDIKVQNSYKTGVDLNGVNGGTLTNIEVTGTTNGFGINMVDSNSITLTDIVTSNNAWGGVSVQTEGYYYLGGSNNVQFLGTFNAGESAPLLLEQDSCRASGGPGECVVGQYSPITGVVVPTSMVYIVYGSTPGDHPSQTYKKSYYFSSLAGAKTFASSFAASGVLIYDIAKQNYYVEPGMKIQDAVNDATSGGTINVDAGTYPESLLVGKTLTLTGAAGKPVISGNAANNYIVKITSNDVVFDNFEVNGGGSGAGANTFDYGVWLTGTDSVEIKNSVIKNVWKVSGNGIQVDDSTNSKVHDNQISSFHKRGIRYVHSTGSSFYNNVVTGDNVDGTSRVQNLVNLWTGSNVEIYGNKLSNALTTSGTATWDSPGIFVSSYYSGYTDHGASYANIHDNEIYQCDTGIVIKSYYSTTDASYATITSNYLHHLNSAINFEQETVGTESTAIHYNIFSTVTKAVNADDGSGGPSPKPSVNAEDNWWDTNVGSAIAALVYANVDYTPWAYDANVGLDHEAPTSAINSPVAGTWQKGNFEVSVTDTDTGRAGTGLCEYHVVSSSTETVGWTSRACKSMQSITVGDSGNCRDQGTGMCQVDVRVTDNSGNMGTVQSRTFSIDYTPPTITTVTLNDYVVKEGTAVYIDSNGADPQGLKSCTAYFDPSGSNTYLANIGLGDYDCEGTVTLPTGIADGTYSIRVIPKNWADLTSSMDVTVKIDDTPPTVIASSFSVKVLEPIVISPAITDSNNIVSATLYYSIGGVDQTPVTKTGTPWQWNIGSQSSHTTITYHTEAEDEAGNTGTSDTYTITIYDFILELESGWNQVSIPKEPDADSLSRLKAAVGGGAAIFEYNATTDAWMQNPASIKPGVGYFIESIAQQDIGINYGAAASGPPSPSPVVDLYSGWNLIGHMCTASSSISSIFNTAAMQNRLSQILWYNTAGSQYQYYIQTYRTDFTVLEPGKGYWIKLDLTTGEGSMQYTNTCA